MRLHTGGPLATLLVLVPLVAVPAAAIIGLPEVPALSATPQPDELTFADSKSGDAPDTGDSRRGADRSARDSVPHDELKTADASPGRASDDPFAEFHRRDSDRSGSKSDASQAAGDDRGTQTHNQGLSIDEGNGLPQRGLLAFNSSEPAARRDDNPPAERPASRPADSRAPDPRDHQRGTEDPRRQAPSDRAPAPGDERRRSRSETRPTEDRQPLPQGDRAPAAGDPFAEGHAQASVADEPRRPAEPRPRQPGPPRAETSREWKAAIERLNALGISEFRLQPGQRDGQFHFSCDLPSPDNPRVVRRFEAEAADPMEAFEDVLRQVGDWRSRHPGHGHEGARAAIHRDAPAPGVADDDSSTAAQHLATR
jgi:hypothetical protein